jgi:4-hydroxy 2-oxovalerate aldolase
MKNTFKLLDCTMRDGGYINDWQFSKKLVREAYRALSKAGVDYVEMGYRGRRPDSSAEKPASGIWKYTSEDDIREVVQGIDGARLGVMGDQGKVSAEDFIEKKDSVVSLIRIAAHKGNLKDALPLLEQLKKKGYEVSLNAMGYSNYSDSERQRFAATLKPLGFLDYVYIADSYGSLFPGQIRPLFEPLLELPHLKVGFHPHNNLQMAFANTVEAISCGVHIVDSTIYGMGRAAGNLQTEIILSYLEKLRADRYNPIPVLNLIDRYFVAMMKETPWGYQLPYMISGMFQCHPDYAKALVDQREYTIEDIWKSLDHIKKLPNAGGFSKTVLNDFINQGHIGTPEAVTPRTESTNPANGEGKGVRGRVPYVNRHAGRDFLVLSNGPTLKDYKPKIDQFIAQHDPIILGANFIGGLFEPHYHAFNNKRRFSEYIETVKPGSKLLLGEYIPDDMIREYVDKPYERFFYNDEFADFGIEDGVITANCRTISILLLGVAIVMGARRIFSVGMDGYMGLKELHFYAEKDDMENQEMIVERHRWCQHYLKQINQYLRDHEKEEFHVLTPTSYKAFYKGIDNYLLAGDRT